MKLYIIIAAFLFSLTTFAQQQKVTSIKETVDAKTFQSTISKTPDAVVLDVRTPEEVADGHIAGAVNIDYNADDFKKKISALSKDKTYFVYCAKGGRSSKAVDEMSKQGIKMIYNLEGGFIGWQEQGLPVKK